MKKLAYTLLATALFSGSLLAQSVATCGGTAPVVQDTMIATPIGGVIWTPAPTLTTQAVGLPYTEYLITKYGTAALDSAGNADTTGGGGNVIIGADFDGIFDPSTMTRYGVSLAAGDTFEITAVGYDLIQVRTLVNKILTGTTSTGATCCQVIDLLPGAAGFCAALATAGITSVNDIHTVADVIDVFDAFSTRQLSVEGLVASMQSVNTQANTPLFPTECGRNDVPICFGINPTSRTKYVASSTIAVQRLSDVANFAIFPNPATQGQVNVIVETQKASELTIRISNTLGQTVSEMPLGVVDGSRTATISTANFAAGMYIVEITDGINRQSQKLIVR